MNKKQIITGCLLASLAATAVGGTLAYFTDTETTTNTMVVGNVEINIDEWQYGENGWEDYDDGEFVLYPLENEQGIKLYNKSVRTYNVSPSEDDAYIRTFVLIEKNEELADDYANAGDCCFPGIHFAYENEENGLSYTSSKDGRTHYTSKPAGSLDETVTVDGKEYWAAWYVVSDETSAIPYDAALSSLHSVWMDEGITQDVIEGWGTDGVQVVVFSQAIQAEGLTHAEAMTALGDVTVEYLEELVADADDSVINDMK